MVTGGWSLGSIILENTDGMAAAQQNPARAFVPHPDASTWKSRVLTQRTQNAFVKCCSTNKQATGKAEQSALGLNSQLLPIFTHYVQQ